MGRGLPALQPGHVWDLSASVGNPGICTNTALSLLFSQIPQISIGYNNANHIDSQFSIVSRANNTSSSWVWVQPIIYMNQALSAVSVYTNILATAIGGAGITQGFPAGAMLDFNAINVGPGPNIQYCPLTLAAAAAPGATSFSIQPWAAPIAAGASASQQLWQQFTQTTTRDNTPSVVNWWNTQAVVVTSGGMPIRAELKPSATGGVWTAQNILTDFYVAPTDRLSGNNALLYLPGAQYRYFDFFSEGPLNKIDLAFWAADDEGNFTPIVLEPGYVASCKFCFERKIIGEKHQRDEDKPGGGSFLNKSKRQRLI